MDIQEYISQNCKLEDNSEYASRLSSQYSFLPKQQKKLANYILNHQDEVIRSSITMLSHKTGIAASTITRFCQSLSYSGFSEMKFSMSKKVLSNNDEALIRL